VPLNVFCAWSFFPFWSPLLFFALFIGPLPPIKLRELTIPLRVEVTSQIPGRESMQGR
jgi:hypothetical protein